MKIKFPQIRWSRSFAWGIGAVFTFSMLLSLLINFSWGDLPSDIQVGRIARQDIQADNDYEVIDQEATEDLRKKALEAVLPVFDWDEELGKEKIVENDEVLTPLRSRGIVIRPIRQPEQPRIIFKDLSNILTVEEAKDRIRGVGKQSDVKATLVLNGEETQRLQEQALMAVKPVVIKVQAGESIVRSGDHFEAWHIKVIHGIRHEKNRAFERSRLIGTFLFFSLLLSVLLFTLKESHAKKNLPYESKDLFFMASLLLIVVALIRLFLFMSGAVYHLLPFQIQLSSLYGVIPVAAAAMMVRLVLPLPIALFFAPMGAIIAGVVLQGSFYYTIFYFIGSVLGVPLIAKVRNRGQILKVGIELGFLNALIQLSLDLLHVTFFANETMTSFGDTWFRVAMAFLGGPMSSVVVLILMPVFESVFNYLTPIKLLEYGSLNHPLLRDMIMHAPGTYHHSHMVGTLAEAGCDAIGADSLFARVASYFHDIGKMKKSSYFIENQSPGDNRHTNLSPSMSALIVASHVKDGMELAKSYKLPQKIIDIIPQHQGTKLISYFYNKAKESENPELHVVDEKDYRYPGPKPQSREAGIILLADTVEASTRSLKDRSPARLEEVVRNMINKNFIDGQLDECELTLKDLHVIANSFVRILMGIYHQRIEYPPEKDLCGDEEALTDDKYIQSKPLREGSPDKASEVPPKNIFRIGSDRT